MLKGTDRIDTFLASMNWPSLFAYPMASLPALKLSLLSFLLFFSRPDTFQHAVQGSLYLFGIA